MSELRVLTNGFLVEVADDGRATFVGCDWLVRVPSGHPEPDCEADCWLIEECGARVVALPGWEETGARRCEHGHAYLGLEAELAPFGPEWEREQREADEERRGF